MTKKTTKPDPIETLSESVSDLKEVVSNTRSEVAEAKEEFMVEMRSISGGLNVILVVIGAIGIMNLFL